MNLGPDYPELLANMAKTIGDALVAAGIPEAQAEAAALRAAERVRADYGGTFIYIPLGMRHEVMKRWAEIWGKWTGPEATSRLAREYRCSEVHITRIVRYFKDLEVHPRHGDLGGAGRAAVPAKPRT